MESFLQRFGGIVLGVLSGFDRLVFRGRLRRLYQPEGMNHYCNANYVFRKEFKEHARSVTAQVMQASLVAEAKRCGRYLYLNSSQIDKDRVARAIADQQPVNEGPRLRPAGAGVLLDVRCEQREWHAEGAG